MGMPRILVDFINATWFTVDRAVGRNAPNDRLDVLLVQFLLFRSTKSEIAVIPLRATSGLRVTTPVLRATTAMPTHPRPQGQIFIHGICGDQTIGFIEYFQEMMGLRNVGVELNGQVAPLTKATKTMMLLNLTPDKIYDGPWSLGQTTDAFPQELNNSFYYYV
jgi:hypothetical protein